MSGTITANGLASRCLRWRNRDHCCRVQRVAAQVIAADAFDGDNRAARQQPRRLADALLRGNGFRLIFGLLASDQAQVRATLRTGVRLSMEAPIRRIFVLRLAAWAQGKRLHGRFVAVVGGVQNNCETRATVGAVDEGIAVTSIRWIEQFSQAVIAQTHVRRNQRVPCLLRRALDDAKGAFAAAGNAARRAGFDLC